MKKYKKIFFVSVFIFLSFYSNALGAEKSYTYKNISEEIKVNSDSTVDVTERQTYDFNGYFHKGWREIPLKGISDITDITVYDNGADGNEEISLKQAEGPLDPLESESVGKYYTYVKNGNVNIEWYYNLADTEHVWTLKYKVHGLVGFYNDHDEIYWNIFTSYDVPVESSFITVIPPAGEYDYKNISAAGYRTNSAISLSSNVDQSNKETFFSGSNFGVREAFTVVVGWPKGVVARSSFWLDWFKLNRDFLPPIGFIFLSIIIGFLYWYFTEIFHRRLFTIIPQYEPPQGIRPAFADIILHEGLSKKTWSSTVIDLAVRGYITINQEPKKFHIKWVGRIMIFVSVISASTLFYYSQDVITQNDLFLPIMLFIFGSILVGTGDDYILTQKKEFKDDSSLEDFEKKFLQILFSSSKTFSTKKLRGSTSLGRLVSKEMQKLEKNIYTEISDDHPNLYSISINKQSIRRYMSFSILLVCSSFLILIGISVFGNDGIRDVFIFTLYGLSILLPIYLLVYLVILNPKLSNEGERVRADIEGFKMYLRTAERYRMQKLTPETFEKYLPYAMIFGVEKQWAKAFESLNMSSPTWYSAGVYGGVGSSQPAPGSFSPVAFSTSFATSFSSSFNSSGASGGSGGGGGAGGGGGGGGGGAS
ncbi:MAG: DUF2207 domain-containing protein [Patescibacteria group bacterium]